VADLARVPAWQWVPIFPWRIVGVVETANDVPRRMPRRGAVLVGPRSAPKWLVFDCPCGRGHRIMLNTHHGGYPRWRTTVDGPLTISPSVDFANAEFRCHFFIVGGRVRWVKDS
jgi:hypothetical protein